MHTEPQAAWGSVSVEQTSAHTVAGRCTDSRGAPPHRGKGPQQIQAAIGTIAHKLCTQTCNACLESTGGCLLHMTYHAFPSTSMSTELHNHATKQHKQQDM
jgi:hypothetical protein